jgi:putative MATE family efflux protein
MGTKHTGIELMETGRVSTAIIKLALPMLAALLAQALYNMTDMFFIGQTGDTNMVAAVSLAFPLFMMAQAIGNIFAVGASSYISRKLGEKDHDEAKRTSAVSFYASRGVGLLMTASIFAFKEPILWMVGASKDTFSHTDNYFSVLAAFMPLAAAAGSMSGQMRSEGATQKAMTLQLIGIVLNIILDPILILGFNMGTAGAGWATVAGWVLSFAYGIRYFLSKETALSIAPKDFMPNKKMVADVLSIGIPAGINAIVMSISNILSNRISASYGDHVVAGFGIQMRVVSVVFMMVFALVLGYQPFAGYNYGAKQFVRLRKGFKLTLLYATGLCLSWSVILGIFGDSFLGFFVNDAKTVEAGKAILDPFLWALPFIGPQITLMVSFQAFGKPLQAMVITLGRQLLFFIPLLYLLNHLFGFKGFVWAQPAAEMLNTGTAILMGLSLVKLMRGDGDHATLIKRQPPKSFAAWFRRWLSK